MRFSFNYIKYYDMAADVLAENIHLSEKYLTPVRKLFNPTHRNLLVFFLNYLSSICMIFWRQSLLDKLLLKKPIENWMIWHQNKLNNYGN